MHFVFPETHVEKNEFTKLNIEQLNPLQDEAQKVIHVSSEIVVLSPTGAGKWEFTPRNCRTALMNSKGTACILKWEGEDLPSFIQITEIGKLKRASIQETTEWETLFISGGRKDKISEVDIAGMFFKQRKLENKYLGDIELNHDCTFVAAHAKKLNYLISLVDNSRLKNKKIRVTFI